MGVRFAAVIENDTGVYCENFLLSFGLFSRQPSIRFILSMCTCHCDAHDGKRWTMDILHQLGSPDRKTR